MNPMNFDLSRKSYFLNIDIDYDAQKKKKNNNNRVSQLFFTTINVTLKDHGYSKILRLRNNTDSTAQSSKNSDQPTQKHQ